MAETIYYCEVVGDYTYEFPKGVFAIPGRSEYSTKISRCVSYSHRVWKQGPRGGVKLIKQGFENDKFYGYGYLTKDPEAMKEFMWVKLRAEPLQGYI